MRSLFLVTLFLIGFITGTYAIEPKMGKAVLKGVVKDEKTGEALAGVKVNIKGTDITAYTNFDGEFEIKGLHNGTYEICLNMVSYSELTTEKEISARPLQKNKVELLMAPSIKMLGYNKTRRG